MEWKRDEFTVTDRREDLDIEIIHHFLSESYWAQGIPRSIVEKAVNNSLCFGLYHPFYGNAGHHANHFRNILFGDGHLVLRIGTHHRINRRS